MANGMGSLYIGVSGLQNSQHALNTTANNLANVDTKGYVRQQVLFTDQSYVMLDRSSPYSYKQSGLGVTIGDVVHTRNEFLDKYYRDAAGRQSFYETTYATVSEVEDLFQELEGEAFQQTLEDFWVSFEELAKQPDEEIRQSLVVQKATLLVESSQKIYQNLKNYQRNMNVQIQDTVDRINKLGKEIKEMNIKIMALEAGNVETAMTLRDQRDAAIDELSTLAKIDVKETPEGIAKIKIEGVSFVDEARCYEMGVNLDKITDFLTPYWPQLSDEANGRIYEVFDFSNGVSTANKTDVGKLKALVMARGEGFASYTDLENINSVQYNVGIGQRLMMNMEAQFDQLIHGIVTEVNNILCPNKEVTIKVKGAWQTVQVWDEENASVGSDGRKPGYELFVRRGCERYTKVTDDDGAEYWVYNEEPKPKEGETSFQQQTVAGRQYTIESLLINEPLLQEEALLPHICPNGETDWEMAARLEGVWTKDSLRLTPDDPDSCSFKVYYQRMMDEMAGKGSVYRTLSETLVGSVNSIENKRQQVIGVSSDEELTSMIKYQNAYNASSRYINVISEMLEHIIMQLGA